MSDHTIQPKAGEKHTKASCCGGDTNEKAHKPAKPQEQATDQKAEKPACCK